MSQSVVVSGDTCKIHQHDWTLTVESGDGLEKFRLRTEDLSRVVINGFKGFISLQSLKWFSVHKTDLAILDVFGHLQTSIVPKVSENGSLFIRQVEVYKDKDERLRYAKTLIDHKIESQQMTVENLSHYYPVDYSKYKLNLHKAMRVRSFNKIQDIMFLEGRTTQLYWFCFKQVVNQVDSKADWQGRDSRDKNNRNANNYINATLNYLYALLQHAVRVSILTNGLTQKVGVVHDAYASQEPLTFDLMEPFRYLCDLTLIDLIASRNLTEKDFCYGPDYKIVIKTDSRKRIVDRFNYNLSRRVKIGGQNFQVINAIDGYVLGFKQSLQGKKWEGIENLTLERTDTVDLINQLRNNTVAQARAKRIGKSTLHYIKKSIKQGKTRKLYRNVIEKVR